MSMSDIDGFLQMHHTGELTEHETLMLKAILRKLGWTHLLNRQSYEAATGTTVGAELPYRVNMLTGATA